VSTPSTSPESSQECREAQHHACRPGWAGCSCWCHDDPPRCLDDADDFPAEAELLGDAIRHERRD
jgi:hypothetical protein